MRFNKGKCKVPYLGRNNPVHQCMVWATYLGSSFLEKVLDVLMGKAEHDSAMCCCSKEG